MEPANLKPDSSHDAQLEAWLHTRRDAPPLPDDGFSARVLAALPPPAPAARPQPAATRGWLVVAAALIGLWLARNGGGGGTGANATDQLAALLPPLQATVAPLADPAVWLALAVTVVSLAFVYRRELLAKLVR